MLNAWLCARYKFFLLLLLYLSLISLCVVSLCLWLSLEILVRSKQYLVVVWFSFVSTCQVIGSKDHFQKWPVLCWMRLLLCRAIYLLVRQSNISGFRTLPYAERLKRLKLPSLELRRLQFDLIYCFKIVFGLIHLQASDFFEMAPLSTTRGHSYKL